MRCLQILDEYTLCMGHKFQNAKLAFYIGIFQLIVCFWSLSQHIYSIFFFEKVLHCDFSNKTESLWIMVGVDAIIFDIGLFHSLWGIAGCVAMHLDGGYGRFLWCLCHTFALLFCLPFAFVPRPNPIALWPLLIQQSAYGVGLLILSLAALPKILPTFMGDITKAPYAEIAFYLFGSGINFFLLLIYYHWYWFVEAEWNKAQKKVAFIEVHKKRLLEEIRVEENGISRKLATEEKSIKSMRVNGGFGSRVVLDRYKVPVLEIDGECSPDNPFEPSLQKNDTALSKESQSTQLTDTIISFPMAYRDSSTGSYSSSIASVRRISPLVHNNRRLPSPNTVLKMSNVVHDYNDLIVPISDEESGNEDTLKSIRRYSEEDFEPRIIRPMEPSLVGKAALPLYNSPIHQHYPMKTVYKKNSPFGSMANSPRNQTPITEYNHLGNNYNYYHHRDSYHQYN
uniref:G protein-coupled receptor n=1 Tax=Rhabditophanes sp. KR3021 TaxID=114890 RepID=A0AC35TKM0_9BILA